MEGRIVFGDFFSPFGDQKSSGTFLICYVSTRKCVLTAAFLENGIRLTSSAQNFRTINIGPIYFFPHFPPPPPTPPPRSSSRTRLLNDSWSTIYSSYINARSCFRDILRCLWKYEEQMPDYIWCTARRTRKSYWWSKIVAGLFQRKRVKNGPSVTAAPSNSSCRFLRRIFNESTTVLRACRNPKESSKSNN